MTPNIWINACSSATEMRGKPGAPYLQRYCDFPPEVLATNILVKSNIYRLPTVRSIHKSRWHLPEQIWFRHTIMMMLFLVVGFALLLRLRWAMHQFSHLAKEAGIRSQKILSQLKICVENPPRFYRP